MQTHRIDALDDPRLDVYRDLRGNNRTRDQGLFLAEGVSVVRSLIESDFETASILISDKKFTPFAASLPQDVPVYRVHQELAQQLVGYSFHAGVLACGRRRPSPTLAAVLDAKAQQRVAILVAPQVVDPENVGALIRVAAAFGVDAVLFGPGTPDPLSRRALRVSLANALFIPVIESKDLQADLEILHERHQVQRIAAVVDPDAARLHAAPKHERFALLVGHETYGLDPRWLEHCDGRMTIDMRSRRVSLNVATAAGIFLHQLTR